MSNFWESLVTIVTAVIGLGVVAVVLSRKSNTAGVIQAGGSALGNTMGVAESPVTGASYTVDLSYPANQGYAYGFGS